MAPPPELPAAAITAWMEAMTAEILPESILARIYQAAAEPGLWDDAIEAIAEALAAPAAFLASGSSTVGSMRIVASTGITRAVIDAYDAEHIQNDEVLREVMFLPVGTVIAVTQIISPIVLADTSAARFLLQPAGLADTIVAPVLKGADSSAVVWASHRMGEGSFSERDRQLLARLIPHVARAVSVHDRVIRAEQQLTFTAGAFDRVGAGVVLVDAQGRPLFANREATRIANLRDGFSIPPDGVTTAQANETRELRQLIQGASTGDPTSPPKAGGGLRIARPSGKPDYQVIVLPLPRRCHPAAAEDAVAILFVTDSERTDDTRDHLVRDLYGFTDAEIRLANELLQGHTLTEAARRLGLSRNTVHSQLSSIFRKTRTSRQGELILRMLQGPAVVRAPDETSGFFPPPRSEDS